MARQLPQREPFRESDLRKLDNIYKAAARKVLATFEGQTDFEQWRRTQILNEINAVLAQTNKDTATWLNSVLPDVYKRGTEDAIKQIKYLGAIPRNATIFSAIDKRSVEVLISETQQAFATSLTTVGKTAGQLLSQAVKDQIKLELATGRITGATRKQVSQAIIAQLKASGITGLVDKRGAQWTLERYSRMLALTKMMEARNTGMTNKALANGVDLVEITGGQSKHKACAKWEGKIVSLTGNTPGYPTLAEAQAEGIFHPGCQHHYNIVRLSLSSKTKAWDETLEQYS